MYNDDDFLQRPEIFTVHARVRDGIFDQNGGATVPVGTIASVDSEIRYTENVCRLQVCFTQEGNFDVMMCQEVEITKSESQRFSKF